MEKTKKTKQPHMQYKKDELGHDILLKDGNLQVMMEWEKPYMEACIDALKPKGDVLEVGFGLGYSATQIQKYHPKSHTIIECDPVVLQKAKEWAKNHSNIHIVEGTWQEQLENLGLFDSIFFDDYCPYSADEVKHIETDAKAIQKAEKNIKVTKENLKAAFEGMRNLKFTDAQIIEFVRSLKDQQADVTPESVIDFIQTLVEQGNITLQQEIKFLDEYEKMNKASKPSAKVSKKDMEEIDKQLTTDRLFVFYQLSLDKHMRKGSNMSSYIDYKQFKNNNSRFESLIAARRDVEYKQQLMAVNVPSNCEYYTGNQALILTITKK